MAMVRSGLRGGAGMPPKTRRVLAAAPAHTRGMLVAIAGRGRPTQRAAGGWKRRGWGCRFIAGTRGCAPCSPGRAQRTEVDEEAPFVVAVQLGHRFVLAALRVRRRCRPRRVERARHLGPAPPSTTQPGSGPIQSSSEHALVSLKPRGRVRQGPVGMHGGGGDSCAKSPLYCATRVEPRARASTPRAGCE